MKVLHILAELQFSGAELMLHTASDRFRTAGVETTILATGPTEGIYADHFRKLGWKIVHIPFRKELAFFVRLYNFIKSEKFAAVHIHTEGAFIYKAFITRWAGTKKVIATVHNNFLFSGYLKRRRQLHHLMALKLLRVKFIAISESVKQTEKQIYYTDTTLIHNWIDVEKFSRQGKPAGQRWDRNAAAGQINIISVGKCLVEKQHQKVLELVKELKARGKDCHYIHIGCGALESQEKLWAYDNGLREQVTFISHTNDVARYLARCNYYVMPSLFEGVGNACLEAMAAGLLCIVNNAPGLNTLINNGETGVVTDFSDIHTVADELIAIHQDPVKYDTMVRNAQQYVSRKHGVANVQQMIGMYS
ncbi:glycosyltransferase family 4 protein [Mucilaginibacter sp. Bleaf8]|uniref:glycosyltransferase family 4 protein n=1 Tax=Mucilaginibacter sp. Bleaf8 TaxID=2834430 RepID=UPI001BCC0C9E|nr:glycosyltransferase family 4 protein [Mucilaginibacter sp. Bleaf8]MBS7566816.1 glycosyltransferase family 4 protein [Mucilaginibacter sp. Bleaf8]